MAFMLMMEARKRKQINMEGRSRRSKLRSYRIFRGIYHVIIGPISLIEAKMLWHNHWVFLAKDRRISNLIRRNLFKGISYLSRN